MDEPPAVEHLVAELVAEINALYGLYLDATAGFAANVKMITDAQRQTGQTDEDHFFFQFGPTVNPPNALLHQTTYGAFKGRNEETGRNYTLLARFLIVSLYELWETGYRGDIAKAAGVQKNELPVPVFGDLRRLRNGVLHNKCKISRKTIKELEEIAPPVGLFVDYDKQGVHQIIMKIKAALDEIVREATGKDPGYRTIWRLS